MTRQFTRALGGVIIGLPYLAAAADASPFVTGTESAQFRVAREDNLPLSKDALFGDLPEEKPSGNDRSADAVPISKDALFGTVEDEVRPAASQEQHKLPDSKDALFGSDEKAEQPSTAQGASPQPDSKESLFGSAPPLPALKQVRPLAKSQPIRGYFQTELARAYERPEHWSKLQGRVEMGTQGRLSQGLQWKVSGRLDYNAIYDLTDFYQPQVSDDQRAEFQLRETYLDVPAGDWEWRLGRQHIVWGEMVGLFFADVVSAKDLREFILPDFQVLRIPQWAARAEYFKDDFHAELIWIPIPSYDNVGKPTDFSKPGSGSDFYPYPPSSVPMTILSEDKPSNSLRHGNIGIRLSQLTDGWDLSGFYYTSMNNYPTWYRDPVVKTTFTPRHDRIWQAGATMAKDMVDFVLKAEAVYTNGRRPNLVTDLVDSDGVVKQNTLDWAVGLDFNPDTSTRVNTQLYQSYTFKHNADTIPEQAETGVSLLVNRKLPQNWQAELLVVHSLNRSDWMARPKAIWGFQPNWKLTFGLDIFGGPIDGLFGQYDSQDRAYLEVRYDY